MWNQIKDTIAGGLTNAIMGLIDGTKTLSESLLVTGFPYIHDNV